MEIKKVKKIRRRKIIVYKEMFLTNNRPYTKIIPLGLVIHWTANTDIGANAVANRNYFQNHPQDQVSAHYVVDDINIIYCIPENEMAWHVGAKKYTNLKYKLFGNENPNKLLIGIEMCVNKDGNWKKTYQNTIKLVVDILKRYNWGIDKIYRHFDITGKDCPRMMTKFFISGEEAWTKFKKDVEEMVNMDNISDWAKESVEKAKNSKLMEGKKGGWYPQDGVTREEFAVILDKLGLLDMYIKIKK